MIFTELSLTNVGLYRGKQTFDLKPQTNPEDNSYRPIILFGGKNGSGKTTILEVIKLCLYGREMLGSRVEKTDYHKYLLGLIHRQPGEDAAAHQARVTLKFQHAQSGVVDNYQIERNWRYMPTTGEVQESFLVQRNEEYLRDVDIDIWQAFIKDLVPSGVSQLFFFDGEKIQELAEDATGGSALADAIKATFGINLVGYLRNDLDQYVRKEEEKAINNEMLQERNEIERKLSEKLDEIALVAEKTREVDQSLLDVRKRYKKTREDFEREGGLFAEKRREAEGRLGEIKGKLAQVEKRIREELPQELMPFAGIPTACLDLKKQLLLEEAYLKWQTSAGQLEQYTQKLLSEFSSLGFFQEASPAITAQIVGRLQAELDALKQVPAQFQNFEVIHGLSDIDRRHLLGLIDRSIAETPLEINLEFAELEKLSEELIHFENLARMAPNEDLLMPLIQKQARLMSQEDSMQKEQDQLTAKLRVITRDKEVLEKKLEQLNDEIRKMQSGAERVQLAARVQKVLEEFHDEMLESRIQELETTLVRYFGQLSRKRNLVWKAQIDRQTFAVTLFTRDGKQLPKSGLSAGEKQIYAIALLWALREISSRPLPVIIDTPLGRLDSDHRQQIIENYFPFASHQVLLLSTDTEIDQTYFAILEPAISHCYHLRYDQAEMRTIVEEGYFWEQPSVSETLELANETKV